MQPHYLFRLLLYLKWVSAHCGWTMSLQESQITSKLGVEWPRIGNSRPYLSLSPWTFISRCFLENQPLFKHWRGITGQCCAAWSHEWSSSGCNNTKYHLLEPEYLWGIYSFLTFVHREWKCKSLIEMRNMYFNQFTPVMLHSNELSNISKAQTVQYISLWQRPEGQWTN